MTAEIRRRTALLMSVGVPYSWSGTSLLLPPPLLLLLLLRLLRLLASAGLSAALSHVTRPEFASAGAARRGRRRRLLHSDPVLSGRMTSWADPCARALEEVDARRGAEKGGRRGDGRVRTDGRTDGGGGRMSLEAERPRPGSGGRGGQPRAASAAPPPRYCEWTAVGGQL